VIDKYLANMVSVSDQVLAGTANEGQRVLFANSLHVLLRVLAETLEYAGHTLTTATEIIDDDDDESPEVLERAQGMLMMVEQLRMVKP
jgi:hypothetical protein